MCGTAGAGDQRTGSGTYGTIYRNCFIRKNGEEQRSPASITKIMTLLLIFEALEDGQITLEEEAVTSAYAKAWGDLRFFWKREKTDSGDPDQMYCSCIGK